ncbi:hypothetical protein V1520DRAFT_369872 [Lipomyces starkeyi]|uniref:Uncharacterized protein n=1 Tax=Lipomyces starkeyi NRRL Y-11557 TaxID=675824 RepID=A0A1E3Q3C0_LIPST|nr:hypothetical protein LIPSTDRAFT_4888 [Lipomyces starkeyi NRRL Y-11557]
MKKSVIKRRKRVAPPVTPNALPPVQYPPEQQQQGFEASSQQYRPVSGGGSESDEDGESGANQGPTQRSQLRSPYSGPHDDNESLPRYLPQIFGPRSVDQLSRPQQQQSLQAYPPVPSVAPENSSAIRRLGVPSWKHSPSHSAASTPPPPIDFTGAFRSTSPTSSSTLLPRPNLPAMTDRSKSPIDVNVDGAEQQSEESSRLPPIQYPLNQPTEGRIQVLATKRRNSDTEGNAPATASEIARVNSISSILNPSSSSTVVSSQTTTSSEPGALPASNRGFDIPVDIRGDAEKVREFLRSKRQKIEDELESHRRAIAESENLLAIYEQELNELK